MPSAREPVADPEYRRLVQRLADFLVVCVPADWTHASFHVTFRGDVRTDFEVTYRGAHDMSDVGAYVPTEIGLDLACAARELREEIVCAGSPACRGFVFHLTKGGKSTVNVEY